MLARRFRRISFSAAIAAAATLTIAIADAPQVQELDLTVGPSTRLLVFAPHPDDESLATAGLIQRVLAGGSVRVALMTSGDAFPEGVEAETHIRRPGPRDFRNYGSLRERETIAALQSLGVPRAHILFLGFPDGGLCLIAAKYLSAKGRAFESPYTQRIEPPASEQVVRGVTYRGTDIRNEIERIILAERPTIIAMPHPEDHHPEHCATSIFVRETLDALAVSHPPFAARVLEYLIHYQDWPLDLGDDQRALLQPPADFPPTEGQWRTLNLTPAEARLKQRALDAYPSQQLVIGRFLQAFARPNELFLEGRAASPPECWCDATRVATETPPERYRRRPAPGR